MFAVNKLNPTVSLGLGNAIGLSGFDEPSSGFQWSFASEGASYITLQQFATFSFIIRLNLPQSFWLNRSLGFFLPLNSIIECCCFKCNSEFAVKV